MNLFVTERNLIWNRYSAMIVAQSVITGAMASVFSMNGAQFLLSILASVGLALALVLLMMTRRAWIYSQSLQDVLKNYTVADESTNIACVRGKGLRWLSEMPIYIFMAFYAAILALPFL